MELKTTELAEIAVRLLDPAFDRILVAQSRIENLLLVTHDPFVRRYLPRAAI